MTKAKIATYYNSLAKGKKAYSASNQSLIPRYFFTI